MTRNRLESNLWLKKAKRIESPNYDDRPDGADISLLVIHAISLPPGEFGQDRVEKFFLNQLDQSEHPYFREIADLQVSSHLYIRRDGSLVQFVPLDKRAWHAGASVFDGRSRCNDFSIGIELEGSDDADFTAAQYACLTEVTRDIQARYPAITGDRIVGHCDIAPQRKTDPGPHFDWAAYRETLAS